MISSSFALGIDIGGTKIQLVLIDFQGKVWAKRTMATEAKSGYKMILSKIISSINEVKKQLKVKVEIIGIGIAGQIRVEDGLVKQAPNLDWHHVPLQLDVQNNLKLPVLVLNDVRAAAYGEWKQGAGMGCDHLCCLFIGTGIGGGIVTEGQLLRGYDNSAGELGHTLISRKGLLCSCGHRGCLEAYAGGLALAKQGQKLIDPTSLAHQAILDEVGGEIQLITAKHVLAASLSGDKIMQKIVAQAIEKISDACVTFTNIFNPQRLIIGGGLGLAYPKLIEKIAQRIKKAALLATSEHIEVLPAFLKENAGAIGAASYALNQVHKNLNN